MISMHNIGSSGEAAHYFSQDNYYTLEEGFAESEWYGEGAKSLGLSGGVESGDFKAVMEGKVASEELGRFRKDAKTGRSVREHRPGTDITFSAPKSVSILAEVGGDKALRQAHEAATKKALDYLEKNLTSTTVKVNGEFKEAVTKNATIALFRHNTSRDMDPQTHTHAVIANMTQREDGKWRSQTNDEWYKNQRVLGAIYISELAAGVQKAGYEIRRTDDKGNFEIEGITREQIEVFSKRRAEIVNSLKERGIGLGGASAQDKEDAALMTRKSKVTVAQDKLIGDWKAEADQAGIDLVGLTKGARAVREAGGAGEGKKDKMTGFEAMSFAAAHLVEREVVVKKTELLAVAIEHGAGRVSGGEAIKAFGTLENEGKLVKVSDGMYTTQKMLDSERWNLDEIKKDRGIVAAVMSKADAVAKLNEIEKRLGKSIKGFKYSQGQRDSIELIVNGTSRINGVQGLAGTGKTTMLKAVRELAQSQGYVVRGMAVSGAASEVLGKETGIKSETVARFQIEERKLAAAFSEAKKENPAIERKKEIWVVDESSFLSQRSMAQLNHAAGKAGAKIVYLGDKFQLQGVEAGKPFELAQKDGMPYAEMTEIARQKTDLAKTAVGIMVNRDEVGSSNMASLANNGKAFEYLDSQGRVFEGKGGQEIGLIVKDVLAMTVKERKAHITVTPYNKTRELINQGVREGLRARGDLGKGGRMEGTLNAKGWTRAMIKEAQYYAVGDVVRVSRDYTKVKLSKGEYLEVAQVKGREGVVVLQNERGEKINWSPKTNNSVEVYEKESRELSTGDEIRMTRSGDVYKNGQKATVLALKGDTATLVIDRAGEMVKIDLNMKEHKHWDHAFASTVHAAQGATLDTVSIHLPVEIKEGDKQQANAMRQMAKIMGDRSTYVAITRARNDIKIYTNDKTLALKAVTGEQNKTSAVEVLDKTYFEGERKVKQVER